MDVALVLLQIEEEDVPVRASVVSDVKVDDPVTEEAVDSELYGVSALTVSCTGYSVLRIVKTSWEVREMWPTLVPSDISGGVVPIIDSVDGSNISMSLVMLESDLDEAVVVILLLSVSPSPPSPQLEPTREITHPPCDCGSGEQSRGRSFGG